MLLKQVGGMLAGLWFAGSALAWEMGEFKSGMLRSEVETTLKSWNFHKVVPVGADGLFAYDSPESQAGRRFLFAFCNNKLVSFDQEVAPAFRHFIVISSNYSNLYGNPFKIVPESNVIASGEKNVLALFWRKGPDYIGVKYALYANDEQLSMTWQVSNNCWSAPR